MKFDAVVGNPPYQVSDGGARASARPIYHEFVMMAKNMEPSFLSFITPSRWYAGGKNLDEFRKNMLNDTHVKELHDYSHPEDIFPNTNNRGGVCYFLWEKDYDNKQLVKIVSHGENHTIKVAHRPLNTRDLGIFIRDSNAIDILEKIMERSDSFLDNHVSAAKAFGLRTFFINDARFHSSKNRLKNPIVCYGRAGLKGYVERNEIKSHEEWVDAWKVYTPESNNIGTELNDDNQNAFVGAPRTVCTETYLVIGADLGLTENEAENLSIYLKTKFARFLHSLVKISQHGTAKTYQFVPIVDFTKKWTDKELYKKYGLTNDEIAYIEESIKPME